MPGSRGLLLTGLCADRRDQAASEAHCSGCQLGVGYSQRGAVISREGLDITQEALPVVIIGFQHCMRPKITSHRA